jgi:putative ABC transport system permease protein
MFRNVVLVLAVALLVCLLVFALIFKQAVQEDIDTASRRLGADIILVPPEAKEQAEEFILESRRKTFYMDDFIFDAVQDLEEIEKVTFHIYLNTLGSGCCSIDEGQVIVFDPESDFLVKPWLTGGKLLEEGQVYVGSYVYEFLGLISTATLFGQGVEVVDHLQQTGTGLDRGIFMRYQDLDKITDVVAGEYKPGKLSIIFVKVKKEANIQDVVAKIRDINPRIGIMTRGDIGADVRATLNDIIRIFTFTIVIASALAIMLAWSTFTAMTNERRREVGILRAIGARRFHIVALFLTEAGIISVLGGLIGVGMGHGLVYWLASDFHLLTRIGAYLITPAQNVFISALALAGGIGVCLIGALVPVARLANMEPLVAIKEE